jgi:hypothetical protein
MRNKNPFLTIINKWKKTTKGDRIAVFLTALFFISFYFWGRIYFFFLAGTFSDTWIISSFYLLLISKKGSKNIQKQLRENAIIWYMMAISIVVSFLFHFVYRRFNDSYVFYFFVLVETISLISGGNSDSDEVDVTEKDQTQIPKTLFGKIFLYLKLLFTSTFSSGMYFLLGFSILFGIWGISNINTFNKIGWDNPNILSVQAISKIKYRLPLTYKYRIHGFLIDSSKAKVGWSFNQDNPRKFKKDDTLEVYPLNDSKWKYIATEFAEMKRPLGSYGGISINGMLIASLIIFLFWLGLMIPITYPALDYLKNEELYKQWENERHIVELHALVIDEAIKIAQAFGPERGIDRENRLREKFPELKQEDIRNVFEFYDKMESQAVNISETKREGKKTKKEGTKELIFKFPQVNKKQIEMAMNQGMYFSLK